MKIILAFVVLISILALIVAVIMLFIKKFRKRGLKVLLLSTVILIASVIGFNQVEERNAIAEGFLGVEDKQIAASEGYTSGQEWSAVRDQVMTAKAEEHERLLEEAREQARLEFERKEQERIEAEAKAEQEATQSAQEVAEASVPTVEGEAEAETAEATQSDAEGVPQSEMAKKTIGLSDDVTDILKDNYGYDPANTACREDGYCSLDVAPFYVNIYGNGIAEVQTSTQQSHDNYKGLCAAVFAGISGADLTFSREAIADAFAHAGQAGNFKADVANVQIKINPDLSNIMACRFFKY